jgi:hypothetical protein
MRQVPARWNTVLMEAQIILHPIHSRVLLLRAIIFLSGYKVIMPALAVIAVTLLL